VTTEPRYEDDELEAYLAIPGTARIMQIERVLADKQAVSRDIDTYRSRIIRRIGARPQTTQLPGEISVKCFACAEPIAQLARICMHCLTIQPEFIEEVVAFQMSLLPGIDGDDHG
jgi:hypothetical protein